MYHMQTAFSANDYNTVACACKCSLSLYITYKDAREKDCLQKFNPAKWCPLLSIITNIAFRITAFEANIP